MSGAVTLGSVGVASLALTTAILPAQTLLVCGVGSGLLYAGVRQSNGQSLNPFANGDDTPSTDKPADVPASA